MAREAAPPRRGRARKRRSSSRSSRSGSRRAASRSKRSRRASTATRRSSRSARSHFATARASRPSPSSSTSIRASTTGCRRRGMGVFGTGIAGVRSAAALAGGLTVPFLYLLLRRDLGRAGAAAGALLLARLAAARPPDAYRVEQRVGRALHRRGDGRALPPHPDLRAARRRARRELARPLLPLRQQSGGPPAGDARGACGSRARRECRVAERRAAGARSSSRSRSSSSRPSSSTMRAPTGMDRCCSTRCGGSSISSAAGGAGAATVLAGQLGECTPRVRVAPGSEPVQPRRRLHDRRRGRGRLRARRRRTRARASAPPARGLPARLARRRHRDQRARRAPAPGQPPDRRLHAAGRIRCALAIHAAATALAGAFRRPALAPAAALALAAAIAGQSTASYLRVGLVGGSFGRRSPRWAACSASAPRPATSPSSRRA